MIRMNNGDGGDVGGVGARNGLELRGQQRKLGGSVGWHNQGEKSILKQS